MIKLTRYVITNRDIRSFTTSNQFIEHAEQMGDDVTPKMVIG